jgi:ER membrane protein complex subunit 2
METVKRLNEVATSKLSEIIRRSAGGEAGWQGYNKAEVITAKELLNRDSAPITR